MKKFKNLKIWQEGIQIVLGVYKKTQQLPAEEKYGLISQMRRCSVSIPSNIARGSSYELETQLLITTELGFIESKQLNLRFERLYMIQRRITNFQKQLK